MAPSRTSAVEKSQPAPTLEPVRLARADRREGLLDAALSLVAAGDVDAVSIESVADRAGVSRPLVYKHFANRGDILTALYLREAQRLHADLSDDVQAAETILEKYRALFRGSIRAAGERGQIFEGLRSAAGRNGSLRQVQRDRDRDTVAFYARDTVAELGVPRPEAEAVTAMLLGAIAPALTLWHARPTNDYAAKLEAAYMCVVAGSLNELCRSSSNGKQRGRARRGSAGR
jgi:AcrR family transcriptional regulator